MQTLVSDGVSAFIIHQKPQMCPKRCLRLTFCLVWLPLPQLPQKASPRSLNRDCSFCLAALRSDTNMGAVQTRRTTGWCCLADVCKLQQEAAAQSAAAALLSVWGSRVPRVHSRQDFDFAPVVDALLRACRIDKINRTASSSCTAGWTASFVPTPSR